MAVHFTFDIEPHDRIEAAADLDCPPELRAAYTRRMEACTRWILDALAEHDCRATFFVVGQVAVTCPNLVRDIVGGGHEVGCHSWDHRRVHRFTPESFRTDLRKAIKILEQAAGVPVVGFRAPTFSVTRETGWAIDVLAEEGIRYDSSVFPVRHDRYGVPDAPRFPYRVRGGRRELLEFPPATFGMGPVNLPAAGGGYFRLFPPAVMRAAVAQADRHPAGAAVLYFHPWEFDPGQPRLPLRRASAFRTYVGIPRARARLKRLLARYGSRPLIEAADEIDRAELPAFRLAG
jgi:polysaccharide deacetylase family protein (PEP-CTERM system associated)